MKLSGTLSSGADPVAPAAEDERRLEAEVRRAAIDQLLAGASLAESFHVLLLFLVAALVWSSLALDLWIGWISAVVAAVALRTWWRLRLRWRMPFADEALRGLRLTVAGVGLAWGVGAAAAIPGLQLHESALLLVVLAGIIAGGTSTLAGDQPSFRALLIAALAPLPFAFLLQGQARFQTIAIVLIVAFAVGMDRAHT